MKNPFIPNEATIKNVKRQSYDTKSFTIAYTTSVDSAAKDMKPGQFVMTSVPGLGEAAFSLSSCWNPKTEAFEMTVREVGNVSGYLHKCKEGDKIGVRGPYGKGWPIVEAKDRNVLIVAGGIGLAPLRPVMTHVAEHRDDYGDFEILYGARTPEDMIFRDEFSRWSRIPYTWFSLTVDKVPEGQAWQHNVGVVTTLFDKMRTEPDDSVVLTCGPEIMMRFVARDLVARGFERSQIYISLERRMRCGIAQCGHCQIGSKFVCKDGPVFLYSQMMGLPDLTI